MVDTPKDDKKKGEKKDVPRCRRNHDKRIVRGGTRNTNTSNSTLGNNTTTDGLDVQANGDNAILDQMDGVARTECQDDLDDPNENNNMPKFKEDIILGPDGFEVPED